MGKNKIDNNNKYIYTKIANTTKIKKQMGDTEKIGTTNREKSK